MTEQVRGDGFDPVYISDPPNHVYPAQRHAKTKLLAFLQVDMAVKVKGNIYRCKPGDKLVIPGNVEYSAMVIPKGCIFFLSEKL